MSEKRFLEIYWIKNKIFSTTLLLTVGLPLFTFFSFSNYSFSETSKENVNAGFADFAPPTNYDDPTCNWINNDEFDSGTADWQHNNNGGGFSSTFTINSASQLSGVNSAFVNISSIGSNQYGIELRSEPHAIVNGTQYTLRFDAKAVANRNITVSIQQRQSPFTRYHNITIPITTTATEYGPYYWTSNVTDANIGVVFFLGASTADVYLDDVIFGEESCFATGGPEICGNGLDDDGDGLIDCADSDCTSSASFTLGDDNKCVSSTTLTLSGGSPIGGVYTGTGVSGGNFNASAAGVGTHTISYTYTDGNGCSDSVLDSITVLALPTVSLTLVDNEECVNNTRTSFEWGNSDRRSLFR